MTGTDEFMAPMLRVHAVGAGAAKKISVALARQTLARHEKRKRRHRLHSANLKTRQEKEKRYWFIREFAEAQIAKDPSLRPLSLDKLASKLEPKLAKPEWVRKLGRQIKAKTIKRALGPAKAWREKVARLP
jgi:hypothetical protein